eukprot:scaffold486637_cov15-Prasinocladus_malaysianus.AAC.1
MDGFMGGWMDVASTATGRVSLSAFLTLVLGVCLLAQVCFGDSIPAVREVRSNFFWGGLRPSPFAPDGGCD